MERPPISPGLAALAARIGEAKESAIPGPVIDAFLPEGVTVGPFYLPPPNMASLLLLHSANSPFVTGRPVTHNSLIIDVATAVHVLATPWDKVREQLARGEISERIWETMAALPVVSPEEMQVIVGRIAAHVNKGFQPALEMGRPGDVSDDEGAQKKTQALDGGFSSSDGSASATT